MGNNSLGSFNLSGLSNFASTNSLGLLVPNEDARKHLSPKKTPEPGEPFEFVACSLDYFRESRGGPISVQLSFLSGGFECSSSVYLVCAGATDQSNKRLKRESGEDEQQPEDER